VQPTQLTRPRLGASKQLGHFGAGSRATRLQTGNVLGEDGQRFLEALQPTGLGQQFFVVRGNLVSKCVG